MESIYIYQSWPFKLTLHHTSLFPSHIQTLVAGMASRGSPCSPERRSKKSSSVSSNEPCSTKDVINSHCTAATALPLYLKPCFHPCLPFLSCCGPFFGENAQARLRQKKCGWLFIAILWMHHITKKNPLISSKNMCNIHMYTYTCIFQLLLAVIGWYCYFSRGKKSVWASMLDFQKLCMPITTLIFAHCYIQERLRFKWPFIWNLYGFDSIRESKWEEYVVLSIPMQHTADRGVWFIAALSALHHFNKWPGGLGNILPAAKVLIRMRTFKCSVSATPFTLPTSLCLLFSLSLSYCLPQPCVCLCVS